MHHLVVRHRQHEVLVEGVDQAERQLVVMVAAVDRIVAHVGAGVVHPAHVPLQAEAQPAEVRGPRHARPGRRFLGDRQHAGVLEMGLLVQLLEERDGLDILPPAVLVGQPVAVLAAVVEVEHRGHGVHANPVHVVLVHPEQGVGGEVVADLVPAVVEDVACPSRGARRGADRRARRAPCRRTAAGRARRGENGPAPSPESPRCRAGATRRRST